MFIDPGREPEWDWCKWLPHTRGGLAGEQWLSAQRERSDAQLRSLAAGAATGTILAVLDSDVLTEGKVAPARDLLRGGGSFAGTDERGRERKVPVAGVVVASTVDRLPAACTTIIVVDNAEGDAEVRVPEAGTRYPGVLLSGLSIRDRPRVRAQPRALRGPRAAPARRRPARHGPAAAAARPRGASTAHR